MMIEIPSETTYVVCKRDGPISLMGCVASEIVYDNKKSTVHFRCPVCNQIVLFYSK